MIRNLFIIILSVVISSAKSFSQDVPLIKYDQLEQMMRSHQEKLLVVNFWATWCGPCVKELPYFDEINAMSGVKVVLVSLDFPEELEKVKLLVSKKSISSDVLLLDETDYDSYMRKVSEDWSGAIPATLFVDDEYDYYFFEKAFEKQNLEKTVNDLIGK